MNVLGGGVDATAPTKMICGKDLLLTNEYIAAGYSGSTNLLDLYGAVTRPFIVKYNYKLDILYAK